MATAQAASGGRQQLPAQQVAQRGVAMMPYISFTSQRPKFYQQPYALPGDTIVLSLGSHQLAGPAGPDVTLRWGDRLVRPSLPEPVNLTQGF